MDPLKGKYPAWKRILHKYQARRDIPFRKRFFVGYDLHGNTYWEFSPDGNLQRLRRKMEPHQQLMFKADYFSTVPPQWLQWLRRTRHDPPTLEDLINEEQRKQRVKILAAYAGEKWALEKQKQEHEEHLKLQAELDRVKQRSELPQSEKTDDPEPEKTRDEPAKDPWEEAEKANKEDFNPIESASFKPRR